MARVPETLGLAPVLLVPDVAASLAHYRDVLGWETEAYEAVPNDYGYARRGAWRLHFARAESARPNSELVPPDLFDVYLWVDDVQAVHDEVAGRGADLLHGPTERPWGMLEIRVRDSNGYILGIGQPL
jgi:catechol 2,3-dioxygenase-like lactoylglutathione lyase family enzyme